MRPLAIALLGGAMLAGLGCGSGERATPAAAPAPAGTTTQADTSGPAVTNRPAGEEVDNPQYASWAKFPKGTTMVQRTVSETEGVEGKTVSTITYKLLEVTTDVAKIESQASTVRFDGYEAKNPPEVYQVRKRLTLPVGMKKEDFGKPAKGVAEGEETLTVGGKTYKARWYTGKDRNEGGEVTTKTWVSDEVPGALLKSVSRTDGVKKIVTIELIELKTP